MLRSFKDTNEKKEDQKRKDHSVWLEPKQNLPLMQAWNLEMQGWETKLLYSHANIVLTLASPVELGIRGFIF